MENGIAKKNLFIFRQIFQRIPRNIHTVKGFGIGLFTKKIMKNMAYPLKGPELTTLPSI
jgi:hypothetical protein